MVWSRANRAIDLGAGVGFAAAVVAAVLLWAGAAVAADARLDTAVSAQDVPAHKRSAGGLYVTASEAHAALQRDRRILLIDIRTHGETVFAGVATPMHRHVPYMMLDEDHAYDAEKRRYKLSPSPDFAKAIEQLFVDYKLERNAPIVLYCSTGERSAKAASYLSQIGYGGVHSMIDGFDGDPTVGEVLGKGWRQAGLPWTHELAPSQTYKSPSM